MSYRQLNYSDELHIAAFLANRTAMYACKPDQHKINKKHYVKLFNDHCHSIMKQLIQVLANES